jgi:septum site-determining protein MinC
MEDFSAREAAESYRQASGLEMETKQSVQGYIAIKGTRNGLLLTLDPGTPFSELLDALARRLAEAPTFFRGAALSVDTSRRSLRVSERVQLEDLLAYYQMSVHQIQQVEQLERSASIQGNVTKVLEPEPHSTYQAPETKLTLPFSSVDSSLELESDLPTPSGELEALHRSETRNLRESDDTLFLRRTVRSGQAIHHHSNVVVLGDVNSGAEIIAAGDVIVWGVLRGMVHAGYPDNEAALVCALQLGPVQLRIAHLLSRPPEGFGMQPRPEVASIRQGQIVVEAWGNNRPRRK